MGLARIEGRRREKRRVVGCIVSPLGDYLSMRIEKSAGYGDGYEKGSLMIGVCSPFCR